MTSPLTLTMTTTLNGTFAGTPIIASTFGPLTTSFSIPSSCYDIPVQCVDSTCGWLEPFRTCGLDGMPTPAADCFPSGTEDAGPFVTVSADLVYGPATGCPGGWESIQGVRTVECCPSGYSLATPTGSYLGQTSCASDVDYSTASITATVCAADSEPTETVFAADNENGLVWAKRILVVMENDDEETSSSIMSRTTAIESEMETSTAEETSEETGGVVAVTSRLPSASTTANAAAVGERLGFAGGIVGVVVGVLAVVL